MTRSIRLRSSSRCGSSASLKARYRPGIRSLTDSSCEACHSSCGPPASGRAIMYLGLRPVGSGRPNRLPTTTSAVAGLARSSSPSRTPGRRKTTLPSLLKHLCWRAFFLGGGCASGGRLCVACSVQPASSMVPRFMCSRAVSSSSDGGSGGGGLDGAGRSRISPCSRRCRPVRFRDGVCLPWLMSSRTLLSASEASVISCGTNGRRTCAGCHSYRSASSCVLLLRERTGTAARCGEWRCVAQTPR
mmetsp:Transcript_27523/g.69662  ORF Transcript_27523/g.69662 Transcript_27523/m.69662 type:complete len:245 (+) Transcript_27523:150-884(+)